MNYASFGSISHGTMRNEDLLDTFASELEHQMNRNAEAFCSELGRKWRNAMICAIGEAREIEDFDSERASDVVSELADHLTEFAPPYAYFGAHPGDRSDYGYWLSDGFADDFDGLKVSDLAEIPDDYSGEAIVVNDHGNVSLYSVDNGKYAAVWAVV